MRQTIFSNLLLLLILAISTAGLCHAEITYWTGDASTSWLDPANWSVRVPTIEDHALIHWGANNNNPTVDTDIGQVWYLSLSWHALNSRLTFNEGAKLRVSAWFTMANDIVPQSCRFDMNGGYLYAYIARLGPVGTAYIRLFGGTLDIDVLELGQDGFGTGTGYIEIRNDGQLVLMDDRSADVQRYIDNGWIYTQSGGRVYYDFHETTHGRTTVMAIDSLNKAWRPSPSNNKEKVPATGSIALSWSSGDGAVSHDVYVSTDYAQALNATPLSTGIYRGRVSATEYMLADPLPNQTYYWRIDEVAGQTVTKGNVWSFTTTETYEPRDLYSDTWVAVDALGRELGGVEQYGPPRSDRLVGLYYCVWHKRLPQWGPYNMTEYLAANPGSLLWTYEEPDWPFWWDEPLFGYYLSDDPWVIRRYLSMLHHAGVDVLIFEATNAIAYIYEVLNVLSVLEQMKTEGLLSNMQFVLWTHTDSPGTITAFYDAIYANNLYSDLWFYWEGKPLTLGYPNGSPYDDEPRTPVSPEIMNFFTWRNSWYDVSGNLYHQWQWGDPYPQGYGYNAASDKAEQVSISTASHPLRYNIGKSFQYYGGGQPAFNDYYLPVTGTEGQGLYFADQSRRALRLDPEFLWISNWNEWVAYFFEKVPGVHDNTTWLGHTIPNGAYYTNDQLNREYNRDLASIKGGYGDNYYHQMIDTIRHFKGVRPQRVPSPKQIITIDGNFTEWVGVQPEYRDAIGDTRDRDWPGYAFQGIYVNTTGRNDIVTAKVAHDDEYIYFYIETHEAMTPYTDPYWMLLLINADQNYSNGWEGYNYVVNHQFINDQITTVANGENWTQVLGHAPYRVVGNQMELAVPRALLGLQDDPVQFDFKWADNIQQPMDIMEFWVSGDAAPDGRFNYRYDSSLSQRACHWVWNQEQGLPGDLNQDCQVGMADLIKLAEEWLQTSRDLLMFQTIAEAWQLNYLPTEISPVTVFWDDFESGTGQWDLVEWTWSNANSYSPSYSMRVRNASNQSMYTKPIDLSGYSAAQITFRYRLNISSSGNGLYVHYNHGPAFEQRHSITNTQNYWQNSWQYFTDIIKNEGNEAKFFHSAFRLSLVGTASTLFSTRDIYVDDVKIIGIP